MTESAAFAGDEDGEPPVEFFIELYAAQRDRLIRLAYLLCGDRSQAEESVAEAISRVWPKWQAGTLRDPGTYLKRAVVNQVIGGFRRGRRQREVEARARALHVASEEGEAAVDRVAVWAALLRLPADQRAAIVLRYFESMTEPETAQVLGTKVGTIKSRVSRGLDSLRVLLGSEDP